MFQSGYPTELTKLRERWGLGSGGKERQAVFDQVMAGLEQIDLGTVPWTKIRPLESLERPEFPTRALPPALRAWVEAESHATQTPTDLAGMLALAVCSATLARQVEVQARPGWREPVNLYLSVLLEPGNRKSAVFNDALKPLRELEAEQIAAAREDAARRQSGRRTLVARLRMLERAAALSNSASDREQAEDLAARLAGERPAVLPRLLVDDATSEKLGMLLAEQGGRIASMSPEGSVFEQMATQCARAGSPQLNVYLMGHSGDDLSTDRVSRETLRIERPALTCAYAMQPAVIKGLAATPAFRGRGLLARFLYAVPMSRIGQREVAPTPVADEIRAAYRDTIRRLAAVRSGQVLELTDDAGQLLRAWEAELEEMLDDGGPLDLLRDWGAKLAGATVRIAAVLHMAEEVEEQVGQQPAASGAIEPSGEIEPIGARALAAAIEVARYLIPHAAAALNVMEAKDDTSDADARYVLRWIERHGRREFTKTELAHHGKRRFPQVELLEPVLSNLAWRGYLRQRPAAECKVGRPASPTYVVNPALFGDQAGVASGQWPVASEEEETVGRRQGAVGQVDCGNIGSAVEQVAAEEVAREGVASDQWPVASEEEETGVGSQGADGQVDCGNIGSAGGRSTLDHDVGQVLPELSNAFVGDLRLDGEDILQVRQPREMSQSDIGNVVTREVELFEILQAGQRGKSLVGNASTTDIKPTQSPHSGQQFARTIGDARSGDVETLRPTAGQQEMTRGGKLLVAEFRPRHTDVMQIPSDIHAELMQFTRGGNAETPIGEAFEKQGGPHDHADHEQHVSHVPKKAAYIVRADRSHLGSFMRVGSALHGRHPAVITDHHGHSTKPKLRVLKRARSALERGRHGSWFCGSG